MLVYSNFSRFVLTFDFAAVSWPVEMLVQVGQVVF